MKVYAEALGVNIPIWHPWIMAILKTPRKRGIRQAPPAPSDFIIIALGKVAVTATYPWG